MAVRWCGDCKITVFWDDHGWYKGRVKAPGIKSYPFTQLHPAPSLIANLAVDSAKAYDGAAAAIMGFYTNDVGDDGYTAAEVEFGSSHDKFIVRRHKGGPVVCEAQ